VYPTFSYLPIFEGQVGKVYIYNDPSNVFNFQTYNSLPVDKTAAAPAVFQLTGNNSSWNGRLAVAYNDAVDGKFSIKYNGSIFDSHVDKTTLSIQDDDVAWFNSVTKSFDLFSPTISGGGGVFQIEVDYMVKPVVASVSPLSVTADGVSHIFTISLSKPFSPQQQGAKGTGDVVNTPVITFSGASLIGTPVAVLDGSGWLTGWTVAITVPSSFSNSSVNLGITLGGTLTYLSGDAFTTTTSSTLYIPTSTAANISLVGLGYTAPSISAFSVSPKTGVAPSYTINTSSSETLTATVSSAFNNAMTCAFWRQQHGTSTRINMGNGTLSSSFTSGGLFFKVFTFIQVDTSWYTTNDLGAQATDTVSSLQSNLFFDSSTYTLASGGGGGGGGGGGCPTLEMYVHETVQVKDCRVDDLLVCLAFESEHYLDDCKAVESHEIQWMSNSTEVCYRFITENGAEIEISESTPIATREVLVALRVGHPALELPALAADMRAGMHVLTDVGNGLEWSVITETICLGSRMVMRLFCGGRNFAAGAKPGKYIFTHNMPVIVK
jgi:hypothetical protein